MTEYALYLESGPKRRKTQVHVLDLLGCVVQGPTTEEALAATPAAIRAFLGVLRRHGDAVDPAAPFTTTVAAHVMEGAWVGNGDPTPGFAPDFGPLSADDLQTYLRRRAWLEEELLALLRRFTPAQLEAEPERGRSIAHIAQHVAGSEGAYLRYLTGPVPGLADAARIVRDGRPADLPATLPRLWEVVDSRLAMLTEAERTALIPHGQVTWSARRCLRRLLEHLWEHSQEMAGRVEGDATG